MLRFNPAYPSVIVEKGKHGDYFYAASTPEEFAATCFEILRRRVADGYWYDEWPPQDKPKGLVEKDDIASIPEGPVRDAAAKLWNGYVSANRGALENNKVVAEAKRIVAEKDWEPKEIRRKSNGDLLGYESAASKILEHRSDYEYEGVYLERLEVSPIPVKETLNAN